ncbi:MAG: efflux RND transporter periplasmic adaptor subunit [gamma proteobacterium symbiont of Bathyaustriella thionipta]|nr:efflux RND transporter periplasmic adaptor subunit [gamma proteobacterium symbiont of Bathyaustriella thionipta]MCU7950501.1 efflux RND transporter periplasmic adaptor subunit [gamma proteobacterium symbiont of Bathyaustriella thionipta]MCU7954272.1 efflux RND transporter periplasmic adaptor subunit [gamma proteobacterium symbiont of Bathyaustriella thionipta]MCU7956995.1 efflux RND transporter periplasmic adaptor subunit [gamma proteobacterium symbiont of Bathyaustriella thionipta]MCU796690
MKRHIQSFLYLVLIPFTIMATCYADDVTVAVKTSAIIKANIGKNIKVYGILKPDPDQVLSLSFPHAGLINRIWVRLGQRVKSGEKLLEVITSPNDHMQYLQAQSTVDFSLRELKRTERLFHEQLATKTQVDSARKSLKDARTSLEALHKRGLDQTQETLRAPMDGIITQLDVKQGQRVQADGSAMLIAAEKRLIAQLGVEPEELKILTVTTPVTISSVFVPGIMIESQIREIHAMINPSTQLVEVLVPIPEDQVDHLVLGSHIIGFIHLAKHSSLMVPRSAVLGENDKAYIYTIKKGKAFKVNVKTGIEENNIIEISGDIHEGEPVITLGNYELSNGMPVREIR